MEQESVIPLFVDSEDLPPPRLPLVGELLEKMFKRQKIRFTKVWLTFEKLFSINIVIHVHVWLYTQVPSKLLIQIPHCGLDDRPYQKLVPDINLRIEGLLSANSKHLLYNKIFCKFGPKF